MREHDDWTDFEEDDETEEERERKKEKDTDASKRDVCVRSNISLRYLADQRTVAAEPPIKNSQLICSVEHW